MKLIAITLLALVASAAAIDWTDCSDSNADAKVTGLTFTPDPAKAGSALNVEADLNDTTAVQGGQLKIEVFLLGVSVHTETRDWCTEETCPTQPGAVSLKEATSLPGITPKGKYTMKISGTDSAGNQIMCANAKFTVQ